MEREGSRERRLKETYIIGVYTRETNIEKQRGKREDGLIKEDRKGGRGKGRKEIT